MHPAHSTGAMSSGFTGEGFAKNRKFLMTDNRSATVLQGNVLVSMPIRATSHRRRVIQYPYGHFSLHARCGAITSRMMAEAPAETAAAGAAPSPEAGLDAVDDPDADAAADADPLLEAFRCIDRGRHGIGMVSLS